MKKTAVLILFVLALAILASCSAGPSVKKPDMDEDTEFIFTGSSNEFTGGREFHITITGTKDNSLNVVFDEMPMASIMGSWEFVEGKGYKFYFDDLDATLCYDAYDPETYMHSFIYKVSLGEGYGAAPVSFTIPDPDFAKTYDGVGLGYAPPVFEGEGYWTPGGTLAVPLKLNCNEDGTLNVTSSSWGTPRTGTWSYDVASNVYYFDFDPQTAWTDSTEYRENRGYADAEVFPIGDDQNGKVSLDEFGLPIYDTAVTTFDPETNTFTTEVVDCIMGTDFMHAVMTFTRLS